MEYVFLFIKYIWDNWRKYESVIRAEEMDYLRRVARVYGIEKIGLWRYRQSDRFKIYGDGWSIIYKWKVHDVC